MDDHVAVLRSVTGKDSDGLLPLVSEPTVVARVALFVAEEDVGVPVFIDAAGAVVCATALGVEDECVFVGIFFEDRDGEVLPGGVMPGVVAGIQLHVISVVAVFGVAIPFTAGVVNVRGGDRVAFAFGEPGVPGIQDVGILDPPMILYTGSSYLFTV